MVNGRYASALEPAVVGGISSAIFSVILINGLAKANVDWTTVALGGFVSGAISGAIVKGL